ncbi:hypothetical protein [Bacteriovorax sp. Seq25_V]|uniref:hypothetical protein n=1 Tax=Bacteriovorax sp. Seq25_V TaxID=1201288 RepID=UPI00038A15EE|nr:hypothetical protein [Bacteriovorax sp. Seq25_V]EQC47511.1 hypothetical protein M900_0897 [Bacteriovorax sp. Seq25_V]
MSQTSLFNTDVIKLASSFNRSTNLELDYKSGNKLSDIFITPKFSLGMTEILGSISEENSNQRVRVLSGSPGLGKSTFALLMSAIVSKKNPRVVKKMIEAAADSELLNLYNDFQKSKNTKLVPVFLNGYLGNIEDAFIEKLKDAFQDVELESELSKVLQKSSKKYWAIVDKWNKDYPEIYESYLSEVAVECDSVDEFQKSLRKGHVSAREIFERIYSKVTGGGSLALKANNDVVSIYKEAITLLQSNGYNGIFVVYDEFGKYLERGIHNPSALNIQFLQDFAEFCDRSGQAQCHLTLITHLSVSQYANQLPINIQKEWAKIEGRFHETSFYDRGTTSMDMISHVFEKNIYVGDKNLAKKVEKFNKSFCDSMKGNGLTGIVDRKNSVEALTKCYPLHPVTLAFLPLLSQRVAQNERTLYTFLTRDEEFGLKRFLDNGLSEKDLMFLMPLDLYNYFSSLIAKDVGVGGSYKVSLIVEEAFGKIPKEDIVAKQIVSLIALSSIVKNYNFAPLNESFIVTSFSGIYEESEVKKAIKTLLDKKVFLYNKILKQYELQQGSSIDIDEEINKFREIKLTSKDLVSRVKNYYKTDFITPKRYNYQNSITRFCDTELISVEELKAGKFTRKPDYYREDGLLYYVVPFDQDELELARRIVRENKDELVIFVLPKTFVECKRDIEELNAINALFGNKDVMNSGPLVRKELDRHKVITIQAIRSVLDPLIGKFSLDAEVFYSKESMRVGINSYAELLIKVGEVFNLEYTSFVPFNNEMINRHKVSGNISLARKQIIDRLSSHPEEKNLGMEGNGPEVTIYKSLVSNYGVNYKSDEKKFTIKKNNKFASLLSEYKEILASYPKGLVVQKLYDTLVAPPYGLRKSIIPLYLSIFDKVLEHPVNHYFDNEYIPRPDGDHYDLMLKHPKNCFVKYTEISKAKSDYLAQLAKVFEDKTDSPTVSSVIEAIFKWKKSVPDYTKNSGKLSVEEKKLLIFIESAKEPDRLVFENLPDIFNIEPISKNTSIEDIELISSQLIKIKKKVFGVYPELIADLHKLLIESLQFLQINCLNIKPISYKKGMSLAKEYQDNLALLPEEIRSYPFNSLTAKFLGRLKSFDSTKHSQYFVETIADALTESNPRYWAEKGKSLFETNLIKCNNEIEMVTELLDSEFSGQSVVAFINKQSGDKEYLRLGVYTDSGENEIKDSIEKLLSSLNPKSRNNLLLSLLKPIEENSQSVEIKNVKGKYIE